MGILTDAYGDASHGDEITFLFTSALGSVIGHCRCLPRCCRCLHHHRPMHAVKFEGVLRDSFALEVFRGGAPGSVKVNGFGGSGLCWVVPLT